MLTSMTGFGRGEASGADVSVVVEIKTVNNRYLDLQFRLPREYAALEPAAQRAVKARLSRGRVELSVRRQPLRSRTVVEPDVDLFRAYLDAIDALMAGRPDAERGSAIAFALGQPGVIVVRAEDVDVMREEDVLATALESALDDLVAMRAAEGNELHADLERHLLAMLDHVDAIAEVVGDLDQRLRERLASRMERLLGERAEPWRIAQEAALAADRSDVSEELARLRSHAVQLREAMERDESIGRRLDFLLQEMNREVNTIGSKAVDHPVSHRVVEMKTVLERMREQAANVE